MAADIPTCEPQTFVAGDSVLWSKTLRDYAPCDGWALSYALRGTGTADVTATANAAGNGWDVELTPTQTGTLPDGTYQLQGWVKCNGQSFTVFGPSVVTVQRNLAIAGEGDLQSSEETELALINQRIQDALSTDIESYSIGQRSVQKRKLEDLYKARGIIIARLGRLRGSRPPTHELVFRAAR